MTRLQQLLQVRSQLAEDVLGYYEALIAQRDATPWRRAGVQIAASTIAVRARVLKREAGPGEQDPMERRAGVRGRRVARTGRSHRGHRPSGAWGQSQRGETLDLES